jgi:hypothetical protein
MTRITCPQGQIVVIHPSNQKKGFVTHFETEVCQAVQKCPAQRGKRDARFHLRFSQQQVNISQEQPSVALLLP